MRGPLSTVAGADSSRSTTAAVQAASRTPAGRASPRAVTMAQFLGFPVDTVQGTRRKRGRDQY
jgi:hypothetical protein